MLLQLRLYLLFALMMAIVYGLVVAVSAYMGVGGFMFYVFLTLAIVSFQYIVGPKLVEFTMRVKYVTKEDEPELYKMVESMAKKANIPTPKLGISEINLPNAFAFGRGKKNSSVCVTRGLLTLLSKDEMKAVIGHEISHIDNRDVAVITMLSVIPMICWYIAWSFMFSRSSRGGGIFLGIGAFALYFITNLLVLYGSRIREFYADRGSVKLGNEPHHLASALYKLVQSSSRYNPQSLRSVEGYKAFFVNNPTNARNELSVLNHVDVNLNGLIEKGELERIQRMPLELSRSEKTLELLSTHPNMLRRIKHLSFLEGK